MNLRNLKINFNYVSFRGLPDLLKGEAHAMMLLMVCWMDNPPTLLVDASHNYSNKVHFSF
ncbi:hypothetical protein D0Y65_002401, partial [Glycine soja]